MTEDEENWRQFIRQAEEETQKPRPDLYIQRGAGFLIGCILGPIFLMALLSRGEVLYPEDAEGGPLGYLFLFVIAIPIGGFLSAIISPLIISVVTKFCRRNRQ